MRVGGGWDARGGKGPQLGAEGVEGPTHGHEVVEGCGERRHLGRDDPNLRKGMISLMRGWALPPGPIMGVGLRSQWKGYANLDTNLRAHRSLFRQ